MKCDECGKERAGFLFGGTNEHGEKCGIFLCFFCLSKRADRYKKSLEEKAKEIGGSDENSRPAEVPQEY